MRIIDPRSQALTGEILKQAPAGLVICEDCDRTAPDVAVGAPDGWDARWSHSRGWIFACPACAADQRLLRLLCSSAPLVAELGEMFQLRPRYREALDRLRRNDLVSFEGLQPSEAAMEATIPFQLKGANVAPAETAAPPTEATSPADEGDVVAAVAVQDRHGPAAAAEPHPKEGKPTRNAISAEAAAVRKAAFLNALRSSGVISDALEAVGLSRASNGWILQQRKSDPDFARQVDELRRAGPVQKAGTEWPVSGSLVWDSPARQDELVAQLRLAGSYSGALRAMGLASAACSEVKAARLRSPAFARRCEEALAAAAFAADRQKKKEPETQTAPAEPIETPAQPAQSEQAPTFPAMDGDKGPRPIDLAPRRYRPDAEICADKLRHIEERKRFEAMAAGPAVLTIEEAKRIVQRRVAVYRASVAGGAADLWVVGTRTMTDQELVAEAERIRG